MIFSPTSVGVFTTGETFGDALYKVVFLRGLRTAFPDARITWFVTHRTLYAGALAPVAAPLLDSVIEGCGIGVRPRELLRAAPRLGPFDLLLDTQTLWWRTLSVRRVPHRRLRTMVLQPRSASGPHILDRLFALLGPDAPAQDRTPIAAPAPFAAAAATALSAGPAHVAIAPGAGGAQKCWPLDRFLAVANQPGLRPVFLLGPAEATWRARIAAAVPHALFPQDHPAFAPLGGPQPLAAMALAARCAAGIANDSGTGHMMAAAGLPLLSLFGPSDADKFAPITPRGTPRGTILRATDYGGRDMALIPMADALAALRALLPPGQPAHATAADSSVATHQDCHAP